MDAKGKKQQRERQKRATRRKRTCCSARADYTIFTLGHAAAKEKCESASTSIVGYHPRPSNCLNYIFVYCRHASTMTNICRFHCPHCSTVPFEVFISQNSVANKMRWSVSKVQSFFTLFEHGMLKHNEASTVDCRFLGAGPENQVDDDDGGTRTDAQTVYIPMRWSVHANTDLWIFVLVVLDRTNPSAVLLSAYVLHDIRAEEERVCFQPIVDAYGLPASLEKLKRLNGMKEGATYYQIRTIPVTESSRIDPQLSDGPIVCAQAIRLFTAKRLSSMTIQNYVKLVMTTMISILGEADKEGVLIEDGDEVESGHRKKPRLSESFPNISPIKSPQNKDNVDDPGKPAAASAQTAKRAIRKPPKSSNLSVLAAVASDGDVDGRGKRSASSSVSATASVGATKLRSKNTMPSSKRTLASLSLLDLAKGGTDADAENDDDVDDERKRPTYTRHIRQLPRSLSKQQDSLLDTDHSASEDSVDNVSVIEATVHNDSASESDVGGESKRIASQRVDNNQGKKSSKGAQRRAQRVEEMKKETKKRVIAAAAAATVSKKPPPSTTPSGTREDDSQATLSEPEEQPSQTQRPLTTPSGNSKVDSEATESEPVKQPSQKQPPSTSPSGNSEVDKDEPEPEPEEQPNPNQPPSTTLPGNSGDCDFDNDDDFERQLEHVELSAPGTTLYATPNKNATVPSHQSSFQSQDILLSPPRSFRKEKPSDEEMQEQSCLESFVKTADGSIDIKQSCAITGQTDGTIFIHRSMIFLATAFNMDGLQKHVSASKDPSIGFETATDIMELVINHLDVREDWEGLACPHRCGRVFPSRVWMEAHLFSYCRFGRCAMTHELCTPTGGVAFVVDAFAAHLISKLKGVHRLLNPAMVPLHVFAGPKGQVKLSEERELEKGRVNTIVKNHSVNPLHWLMANKLEWLANLSREKETPATLVREQFGCEGFEITVLPYLLSFAFWPKEDQETVEECRRADKRADNPRKKAAKKPPNKTSASNPTAKVQIAFKRDPSEVQTGSFFKRDPSEVQTGSF